MTSVSTPVFLSTKLLTREETAARLDMAASTLDKWRSLDNTRLKPIDGSKPSRRKVVPLAYVKVGGKIRYREADVESFLAARRVMPGEQPAPEPKKKRGRKAR